MEWNYRPVSPLEVAIPLLFLHPQGRQQQKRKACQERASFTASCYLSIVVVVVVCVCVCVYFFFLSFVPKSAKIEKHALHLRRLVFSFFFLVVAFIFISAFSLRFLFVVSSQRCLVSWILSQLAAIAQQDTRKEKKEKQAARGEREREIRRST